MKFLALIIVVFLTSTSDTSCQAHGSAFKPDFGNDIENANSLYGCIDGLAVFLNTALGDIVADAAAVVYKNAAALTSLDQTVAAAATRLSGILSQVTINSKENLSNVNRFISQMTVVARSTSQVDTHQVVSELNKSFNELFDSLIEPLITAVSALSLDDSINSIEGFHEVLNSVNAVKSGLQNLIDIVAKAAFLTANQLSPDIALAIANATTATLQVSHTFYSVINTVIATADLNDKVLVEALNALAVVSSTGFYIILQIIIRTSELTQELGVSNKAQNVLKISIVSLSRAIEENCYVLKLITNAVQPSHSSSVVSELSATIPNFTSFMENTINFIEHNLTIITEILTTMNVPFSVPA